MFILLSEEGGRSENVWFGCRRILGQRRLYNVVSSLLKVNNSIYKIHIIFEDYIGRNLLLLIHI